MIRDLNEFHLYIGETVMFCQRIEHDIKLIYAGMCRGDFNENYKEIEKETLGKMVKMLESLDNSDNSPYFSENDYKLLREITEKRNHWAHKAYCEFIYSGDNFWRNFEKQARKLYNEHNRLQNLCETIEKIRLDIIKQYDR